MQNKVNTAAAGHLSKSIWPKLCIVYLQHNAFDDTGMAFLARGNWPNLREITLFGKGVSVLGRELLMTGQWPQLSNLVLDAEVVTAPSWTLLNLSGPLPDCAAVQTMFRFFSVPGTLPSVSADEYVVWPDLDQVEFALGSSVMRGGHDR